MNVPATGSPKPTALANALTLKKMSEVSGVTSFCSLKSFGCWYSRKMYLKLTVSSVDKRQNGQGAKRNVIG